jgi:hypothetical protein
MQRMADITEEWTYTTAPDGMKESNLGLLAYENHPQVLCPRTSIRQDRFDKVFRVYTERWALNIPHQMIF